MIADDDNNVDISSDEFSCTDVGKENCRLIDEHHIGDFFCLCVPRSSFC